MPRLVSLERDLSIEFMYEGQKYCFSLKDTSGSGMVAVRNLDTGEDVRLPAQAEVELVTNDLKIALEHVELEKDEEGDIVWGTGELVEDPDIIENDE